MRARRAMPAPIDILFNCAGFVHQGTLLEATEDEWTLAFELKCARCSARCARFCRGCWRAASGVILNMASVASSLKGVPNRFIYSATKAAVIGMTKSVATDYMKQRHPLQLPLSRHGADTKPGRAHRGERGAGRFG